MDEDRRIRFLVAPVLFLASLFWGAYYADTLSDLHTDDFWSKLIEIIAASGVVVLAGGYVIGTISYFVLRLFFQCLNGKGASFHEAALSRTAFQWLWEQKLKLEGKPNREQELFAVVAYDHGVLQKEKEGVHRWLVRRWSGFNVAVNSICGLLLSFVAGWMLGVPLNCTWWAPVGVFIVLLVFVARWAWRDTMDMVEFMVQLPDPHPVGAATFGRASGED
jgi:hypothetical protein